MARITTIALDADDTLWQNEQFYDLTKQRFAALLADYTDATELDRRLMAAVTANLGHYGFGMKGFALSMVETALEITDHRVPASVIAQILDVAREMLTHPVEVLPQVEQTLQLLQQSHRLIMVTKGDMFDQERKIAASGLAGYFAAIEIVADKTESTYRRIFARHTEGAQHTIMVGNSLRSDIVPALAAGSFAAYVPHALTWSFEHADEPQAEPRYARLATLSELPTALARLEQANP
jgi:putative hydrolase of the HAD superfamily